MKKKVVSLLTAMALTAMTLAGCNGFQFKGTVRGFDSFTVVLENEGKQNLVYKHAISTIVPSRNIDLNE